MKTILLKSGELVRAVVMIYCGACITGDPTACVVVRGQMIWVIPGESVAWVEA